MRGLVRALLDVQAPVVARKPHSKRPRRGPGNPPAGVVLPGEIPRPGFDQVDEPLPGFEGIPPATLREMNAAMEKITRGQGPPPGFYDPSEADQRAPLS